MDNYLINLLHKEFKIGKMKLTFLHILLFVGITFATLMMRYCFRDNETWDYFASWKPWVEKMREMGGFKGLSGDFYNYTPAYITLILLLSYLPINLLYSIKMVSVIFDIIMSVMSGIIIYDITKNRTKAIGIYSIMMLVPTVANNSALWGQCDVIYSTAILYTIYYLINDKPAKGMFFYGIAFALKLQSLFVFPALIVLWALKKIDLKHFLFMPVVYFAGILPAWIAGRPLKELLLIYARQAVDSPQLSLGYPNIYHIIGTTDFIDVYSSTAIWLTLGFMMVIMYYIARSRVDVSKEFVITLFLLFVLISTCFLPFMHERYAYVADVLTVIYAFIYIKKFYIPLIQILISFSAYSIILSAYVNVPVIIYSFASLFLIYDIGMQIYRYVVSHQNKIKIT
jgi:Gpi18-like mannosyltransferase